MESASSLSVPFQRIEVDRSKKSWPPLGSPLRRPITSSVHSSFQKPSLHQLPCTAVKRLMVSSCIVFGVSQRVVGGAGADVSLCANPPGLALGS